MVILYYEFFFFKQKTAYERRISDWSSDVCSSDLSFSELTGTGTLALGAKTHGTGGGLDGDLAAAVGNAIATQIKACWDAPRINLPDDLSILMTVSFTRDGHVNGEPSLTRVSGEEQLVIADPGPFEMAAIEANRKSTRLNSIPNAHLVCILLLDKQTIT